MTTRTTFKSVTLKHPCPVCAGNHKCSQGEDGSILCGRKTGDQPGFLCLGPCSKDPTWTIYRSIPESPNYSAAPSRNGNLNSPKLPIDWHAKATSFSEQLTEVRAVQLSELLGLPAMALRSIELLGYSPEPQHHGMTGGCWTFPECDGNGNIVGITGRYEDGSKKAMSGSRRGLTIPINWRDRDGPIVLPEGGTDVLALFLLGLIPIGRPSNRGGIDELAVLLKDVPTDRPIIMVGENDQKSDGNWPGRDGANESAEKLSEILDRPVLWSMTPDNVKDCRKWITERLGDLTDFEELGQDLLRRIRAGAESPKLKPDDFAFRWNPVNSETFARNDYRPNWLVKGALVEGQPCVVGGPQKSLKTTIAVVDLGISLASATPWLGHWEAPSKRRTCILSGESGAWTLQETANRICNARGLKLEGLGNFLFWQFRLPQLSVDAQLETMRAGLERDKIEVVIIDPLYLSLLAGNTNLAASNLYDIGPLLLRIAQICQSIGVTLILAHHTIKPSSRKYEPLDLTDLAFSGVAEFARQWVLLSRRQVYEGGTGKHVLWMVLGGSCGHGGHYAIDIDEGQLGEDFNGRKWEVSVLPAGEARQVEKATKVDAKAEARRQRDGDDEQKVIRALDQIGGKGKAVAYVRVHDLAGLSRARMGGAVERLLVAKQIKETTTKVKIGSKAKRSAKALIRVGDDGE